MEIKDQVCTFEQAKRLHELGVISESFFYWAQTTTLQQPYLQISSDKYDGWVPTIIPAFTVAELGHALEDYVDQCWCEYPLWYTNEPEEETKLGQAQVGIWTTEASARARALIRLIEVGELSIEQINQRLSE